MPWNNVTNVSQIKVGSTNYYVSDAEGRTAIDSIQTTLSGAIRNLGVSSTAITDGSTVNSITTNKGSFSVASGTLLAGDMVSYGSFAHYVALDTEPADWETNWTNYYEIVDNAYVAVGGASAPTFVADKYYTTTTSAGEFIFDGTTWQEFGSTSGLGELAFKDSAFGYATPQGTISYYNLVEEEPENWATTYTNYFTKSGTTYTAVAEGAEAPTFATGTYYAKGNSGGFNGASTTFNGSLTPDLQDAMIVSEDNIYTIVATEPADWATTYTSYYYLDNGTYTQFTAGSSPTFGDQTVYQLDADKKLVFGTVSGQSQSFTVSGVPEGTTTVAFTGTSTGISVE